VNERVFSLYSPGTRFSPNERKRGGGIKFLAAIIKHAGGEWITSGASQRAILPTNLNGD
jgi:hypothetical protein